MWSCVSDSLLQRQHQFGNIRMSRKRFCNLPQVRAFPKTTIQETNWKKLWERSFPNCFGRNEKLLVIRKKEEKKVLQEKPPTMLGVQILESSLPSKILTPSRYSRIAQNSGISFSLRFQPRCKSQEVGCALESLIGAGIKSDIGLLWSLETRKIVGKRSFKIWSPRHASSQNLTKFPFPNWTFTNCENFW